MTTKKTPLTDDAMLEMPGNEAELDQAIDDLRDVLKNDPESASQDLDAQFGFTATEDAPLGGDLGGSDFGSTDFGTDTFGSSDFGGSTDSFEDTPSFGETKAPGSAMTANLDLIMDIPIDVEIVLGKSRMQVSGLMNLEEGATIALDRKIGEPVEIMVNGRRIARGEITVLENDDTRFGVKLIEVMSSKST